MTLARLTLPYSHLKAQIVSALGFTDSESETIDMTNVTTLMEALGHINVDATTERFSWRRHALNAYELTDIFANAYEATHSEHS